MQSASQRCSPSRNGGPVTAITGEMRISYARPCDQVLITVSTIDYAKRVAANVLSDDYVKSLKSVVSTNDEIDKALHTFLQSILSKNHEHIQFLKEVDSFHTKLTQDLASSAKDVSNILAWLADKANAVALGVVKEMSTAFQGMKTDAEELGHVCLAAKCREV